MTMSVFTEVHSGSPFDVPSWDFIAALGDTRRPQRRRESK